jgi:hypothetical protein
MPDDPTIEEARALPGEMGLSRLTDQHLQEFVRAMKTARARKAALRVGNLTPADEPASVFRLGTERVL